jgi:NADH-quinone oxidoreductase subunit C
MKNDNDNEMQPKPEEVSAEVPKKAPAKAPEVLPEKPEVKLPDPGEVGQKLCQLGVDPIHLGLASNGVEMLEVPSGQWLEAAFVLKQKLGFDLLLSVSGVDWKDRMEGVYHLYNTETFKALVVKVTALEDTLPSVFSVWRGADWHERETYDLFGIHFVGHPNLSRILMPVDWIGHPMRKDYKLDDPRLVWNER